MSDISEICAAPQWLLDLCTAGSTEREVEHKPADILIEIDQGRTELRCKEYLRDSAPTANQGERNGSLFVVAARLRDFGASEQLALALVEGHWNGEKCVPALDHMEVEHVVRSAYKYSSGQKGNASPEFAFAEIIAGNTGSGDWLQPPAASGREPIVPVVFDPDSFKCALSNIPKREWILGRFLLTGQVTVLIAPPGAGKSMLSIGACLSVATGRNIIGMDPFIIGKSLIINNEDDIDEMHRRIYAFSAVNDIALSALTNQLHVHSGIDRPFIIAKRTNDGAVKQLDFDAILDYVVANSIKVVVADPFIETHLVSENSNEEIAQVGRLYRRLAQKAGCAVLLVHHTKKPTVGKSDGYAGSADSGRGASALTGVARIVSTLYTMTDKDAKQYGIDKKNKHRYARLDDAKANMSLMSGTCRWFEKKTHRLSNGDDMGVMQLVALSNQVADDDSELLGAIVTVVRKSKTHEMQLGAVSSLIAQDELVGRFKTRAPITKAVKALLEHELDGLPFEDTTVVLYKAFNKFWLKILERKTDTDILQKLPG